MATSAQRHRRNEFAHGLWGASNDVKDALIWADSNIFIDHQVATKLTNRVMMETRRVQEPPPFNEAAILVYSRAALLEVKRHAHAARSDVGLLASALYLSDGASIVDPIRQDLLQRPHIELALQRLKKRNSQQAPPPPPPKSPKRKR
jgi:hypothetical protein